MIQKAERDKRRGVIEKTYEVKCLLEDFIERNYHDKKQEKKKRFHSNVSVNLHPTISLSTHHCTHIYIAFKN